MPIAQRRFIAPARTHARSSAATCGARRPRSPRWRSLATLACLAFAPVPAATAQTGTIQNSSGIRMTVDPEDHDPALLVTLPGGPAAQRSFKVLLPEHLTVHAAGEGDPKHLYIFQPGLAPGSPQWLEQGSTLQYTGLFGTVRLVARATLTDDGLEIRYDLANLGDTSYTSAIAVTDPRFHTIFYDPRLERTYVHFPAGTALLAGDTPERLTIPLNQWFPVRYHAQYTAPIPDQRVQRDQDGITRRYASQKVDLPWIATVSADGQWVAASTSRDPGNVWSNPELTCQHVDVERPLPPHGEAHLGVDLLLLHGSLDQALRQTKHDQVDLP